MPPTRPRGRATLSDLLADDVRDYFLREGVSDQQSPERRPRKNNDSGGKNNKSQPKRGANRSRPSSPELSSSTSSPMGLSLRMGWATGDTSSLDMNYSENKQQQPPPPQQQQIQPNQEDRFRGQHADAAECRNRNVCNNNAESTKNDLQMHFMYSADSFSSHPQTNNQTHRRHSSGSSSFHSMGSGSAKSLRSKTVSAADAEFLRRYAEEKERTNLRMLAARPNWGLYAMPEAVVPHDAVPAVSLLSSPGLNHPEGNTSNVSKGDNQAMNFRPYHCLLSSPRPPTVTGSHRPGLPSIDNDDWEEDDRIERHDRRKMERREQRKLERQTRRRSSSMGGDISQPSLKSIGNSDGALSVVYSNSNRSSNDHRNSKDSNFGSVNSQKNLSRVSINDAKDSTILTASINSQGNLSVVYSNIGGFTSGTMVHDGRSQVDAPGEDGRWNGPYMLQGSTAGAGGAGITPGSERYESGSSTLCYSTGSSQLHGSAFPPEMPFHHVRADSMATFVHMGGKGEVAVGIDDGGGRQQQMQQHERYLHQETMGNVQEDNQKKKSHVRPLSYLSASSDSVKSGSSDEQRLHQGANNRNREDSISSASPFGLGGRSQLQAASSPYMVTSPHNSSSGTYRHTFHASEPSHTCNTDNSLLGPTILKLGPSSGEMRFSSMNNEQEMMNNRAGIVISNGHRQQQQLQRQPPQSHEEEESSDESYDSEDDSSEESSYTSDSYYGDSSSQTFSERRPKQQHQALCYQSDNTSKISGMGRQPTNFSSQKNDKDIERGATMSNERNRLKVKSGRGLNYSSIETFVISKNKPRQKKKNRENSREYKSSFSGNRQKLGGGPGGSLPLRLDDAIDVLLEKLKGALVLMELFISNMPSLVGSLALAWASLGVDWFKWYEETFDACVPAAFHSPACVFAEFPGCFACETERDGYQFILHFHSLCSTMAFILSSFLVGKIMIAFPVVRDELANPTTAAPLGLLCMAFEKVFAGNFGQIGEGIVFTASALHSAVFGWFIFISIVYRTLPEPSWFSNTTGIGLAAAKVWTYWSPGGYFLEGLSLLAFAMFYVVALYRIHTNDKISAPVCWVQLSAPAVVLYGFTIFGQPGSDEGYYALLVKENKEHFYQIQRQFYMPVMHMLFAFCMVSMASSLYLLRIKWKSFREKEFSPAHVSFCAPLVSHANGLQAYRSSLNKYSLAPPGTTFKLLLYHYWSLILICGTVLVFTMTCKFLMYLPRWCQIDVEDDEMPPAPEETVVTRLLQKGEARDEMKQNFVSAAVLQANESGALVRVLQDGKMKYVRSRRMPSMGFDPIMNVSELMSERDRLLQHVAYAAIPSRNRGGMSSFDDVARLDSFREPDQLRPSLGRRRLNFLSFDASSIMRGDHMSHL